jgi:glucose/arabinose dehydrogenase
LLAVRGDLCLCGEVKPRVVCALAATAVAASLVVAASAHALGLKPVVGPIPTAHGEVDRFVDAAGVPGRMLLVEQAGRVRVLRKGRLLERPYLDLRSRVLVLGLRGLLSIAPAPDYRHNRLVYVFYVDRDGDIRVDEFRTSLRDPNVAVPSTRRAVLRVDLPVEREGVDKASIHVGGCLRFGPDGLLYVSIGDGGQGYRADDADPWGDAAPDLGTLLGKLLRIDPSGRTGHRHYGIPHRNPFYGSATGRGEIFSLGFRNPWRFAFDGNRLTLADAGSESREEVNLLSLRQARGAFFGWPTFEGQLRRKPGVRGVPPVFAYEHRALETACNAAVIGGHVIRERGLGLYGRYLYGDFCRGELRSFDPRDPYGSDRLDLELPKNELMSINRVRGRTYLLLEGGAVKRLVP